MFGQKWLYSGKSGFIRGKNVIVFGPSGCNRATLIVFGQSGCVLAKVVVFGQKF